MSIGEVSDQAVQIFPLTVRLVSSSEKTGSVAPS